MPLNQDEINFFARLEHMATQSPPKAISKMSLDEFREASKAFDQFGGSAADISYRDLKIPARDGYQIPLRIYHDDLSAGGLFIFCPGTAFVCPQFELNAIAASRIADYANIKVAVIDYRLAPEYLLPIATYDCFDVTQYLAAHADEFHFDATRIMLGGLSSGANCALGVALLAREQSHFKIYHEILCNGLYDFSQSQHAYDDYAVQDKLLTAESIAAIIQQTQVSPTEFSEPLISPVYARDLTGLPPITLVMAEYDGLRNDSEALYQKLLAAGNQVKRVDLPGQTHNTLVLAAVMDAEHDVAKTFAKVIGEIC